ncbi:hypothetical protein GCM10022252_11590 [Streptosporangium oxazolinicum]|uniref:Uncharacterized protein n=1 Tax=Streptosporangium oxazolinicum TaxID=909287 RepID=A0ABP8AGV5_9ACTN
MLPSLALAKAKETPPLAYAPQLTAPCQFDTSIPCNMAATLTTRLPGHTPDAPSAYCHCGHFG